MGRGSDTLRYWRVVGSVFITIERGPPSFHVSRANAGADPVRDPAESFADNENQVGRTYSAELVGPEGWKSGWNIVDIGRTTPRTAAGSQGVNGRVVRAGITTIIVGKNYVVGRERFIKKKLLFLSLSPALS